jgi:hypothetical protein
MDDRVENPRVIVQRALLGALRRRLPAEQVNLLDAAVPSPPPGSDALLRGFLAGFRETARS